MNLVLNISEDGSLTNLSNEDKRKDYPFTIVDNSDILLFPQRFNVAITRAKALLIVIGNPYVLCHDEHWRRLVDVNKLNLNLKIFGMLPKSRENELAVPAMTSKPEDLFML